MVSTRKEIEENAVKLVTNWQSFDNPKEVFEFISLFGYNTGESYRLYNEDDAISFDEITNNDYNKGIFILGHKVFDFSGIIDFKPFEMPFCNICYTEEDFKDCLKNVSTKQPLYFFISSDDCFQTYQEKIEEEKRRIEAKAFEPRYFNGDIIITDPCYIEKKINEEDKPKWKDYFDYSSIMEYPDFDGKNSLLYDKHRKIYDENYQKWSDKNPRLIDITNYENFDKVGFTSYISHDTIYGDWSCTTYNSDTKESIGNFCADSGMVGVFLLDEVLKYNPDFDYHLNKPWTTTLIKNFKGYVKLEKLDKHTLIVKGEGNINFETRQTDL